MTGISNTYSSVLRNVANIITIILSLITTLFIINLNYNHMLTAIYK